MLHLNHTAAEYAYHLVKGHTPDETLQAMAPRYNIPPDSIKEDFKSFTENLINLLETPDLDPVTFFDVERAVPHGQRSSAPIGWIVHLLTGLHTVLTKRSPH